MASVTLQAEAALNKLRTLVEFQSIRANMDYCYT